MGLVKWYKRLVDKVETKREYSQRNKTLATIGLSRTFGEREYPLELGELDGIAEDHLFRYNWALNYCASKSVLDYGCGVGYGSFILSKDASEVIGFDISAEALAWAEYYAKRSDKLSYVNELPDKQFECITCFECIEHVPNPEQIIEWFATHVSEYLFISSPIPDPKRKENKYHLKEFTEMEFIDLLSPHFVIEEKTLQHCPYTETVLCRCKPVG